tara:strand:+ start:4178 stop:5062 length:885 start_codon:yes stop_codon:yes gene_type:complete
MSNDEFKYALLTGDITSSTIIKPNQGGTGLDTYNQGDLLYCKELYVLDTIPIGKEGSVLISNINITPPQWQDISNIINDTTTEIVSNFGVSSSDTINIGKGQNTLIKSDLIKFNSNNENDLCIINGIDKTLTVKGNINVDNETICENVNIESNKIYNIIYTSNNKDYCYYYNSNTLQRFNLDISDDNIKNYPNVTYIYPITEVSQNPLPSTFILRTDIDIKNTLTIDDFLLEHDNESFKPNDCIVNNNHISLVFNITRIYNDSTNIDIKYIGSSNKLHLINPNLVINETNSLNV